MLSRVGALLVICAAAWWAAAALGADPRATPRGEYDGAVTVSLTATYSATGVYDPANPGTERQTEKLQWDQSETVVVYGLDTGSPTFVVTSGPSLTVSGLITTAAAPPNQSLDCSGTLSARPGAPLSSLFASVLPGRGRREVNVGANFVPTGDYIQSTGSGACRADPGGGVGLSVGTESTKVVDAKTAAETPIATHTLSSPPETQTFTSGGPQSTPTVTSSFYASFTVGPSCPANARAAADATASMPAESCTACPNPVDDPLPGEAERRAYDIYHDRFFGGNRNDGLAESALIAIRVLGGRLRREFPRDSGPDRAERKRRINEGARKADAQIERAAKRSERLLREAEAQDVARAKCPDVKQRIRDIYEKELQRIDEEVADDLKFVANEVVGTVNGFCGCHLSRDLHLQVQPHADDDQIVAPIL